MIHLKKLISIFVLLMLGTLGSSQAATILFHVKTALDKDDAQICVAPNVALAAQKMGDTVVILIDASAVTPLGAGQWGHDSPC